MDYSNTITNSAHTTINVIKENISGVQLTELLTPMTNVRLKHPLVHNITNYVTVNDCANILLSIGASPIMSDDQAEVSEITSICNALVINIGTLNARTIASMYLAGKTATELKHPIVLDPVGSGASNLRTDTARGLLDALNITAIRGNISEVKSLTASHMKTQGVDANDLDAISEDNLEQNLALLGEIARSLATILVVTGRIDVITDGQTAYTIKNGHQNMKDITGTGCMLSSVLGAFISANPDQMLEASVCAVAMMGISGEKANAYCEQHKLGTSSMRTRLIDLMGTETIDAFKQAVKVEKYTLD